MRAEKREESVSFWGGCGGGVDGNERKHKSQPVFLCHTAFVLLSALTFSRPLTFICEPFAVTGTACARPRSRWTGMLGNAVLPLLLYRRVLQLNVISAAGLSHFQL